MTEYKIALTDVQKTSFVLDFYCQMRIETCFFFLKINGMWKRTILNLLREIVKL